MKETTVIAIGNQKGGVGKTTNTVHLGTALGEMGYQVLVWDLDVNAGSTLHFGIPPEAYANTFHVLSGEREPDEAIITEDDPDISLPKNVHVIPSGRELEKLGAILASEDVLYNPADVLVEPLQKLSGMYDYILLDTAPSATIGTISSYMVADFFILSVIPERFAVEGLKNALRDLRNAQRPKRNPHLKLLGVIVSGFDKRIRKAREYNQAIEESFAQNGQGDLSGKFKTSISRAAAISQAQDQGVTVFQTNPQHRVVEQFRDVANEAVERISVYRQNQQTVANG